MNIIRPLEFLIKPEKSAIVWLNGHVGNRLTDRLWNASRLRYAADGAANIIYDNLKKRSLQPPHKVVGDMDSIDPQLLKRLTAEGIIEHITEQDTTDMTKTFRVLAKNLENDSIISNILVLGGLGGRFDHVFASLKTLVSEMKPYSIPKLSLDDINILMVLPEGSHHLELGAEYKTFLTGVCGIVPICQRETRVTTQGFKWNLASEVLSFEGLVSTSNQVENSSLFLETSAPLLFMMELRKELLESSS
ncbi:unnamed protein product, partial [Mesorhabditis belari]|uniref:Thiamin pyrophosphokinase thiamin-binding domain-containing protein n=1 Tax=Mesorhabditis belari TaxID=2138241 RepID=A0AAF3E983_9BILA